MPQRRRRSRHTLTAIALRQIAWGQKGLILCLLGHLLLWIGYIVVTVLGIPVGPHGSDAFKYTLILSLWLGIFSGVFVLLGEARLSGLIIGIFLGLLTVVPCLGLILILITNTRTTTALQARGVKVGLLGARLSDLYNVSDEADSDEWDDDEEPADRRRRPSDYDVDEREGW